MNILDIYKKYHIMPQLAGHQLRVAAVGEMICDNVETPINKHDVAAALLLHDMGNIIKFDLGLKDKLFSGQFTEQEMDHWRAVQQEFRSKYGQDVHQATQQIAGELGVSARVTELIGCVGFETGVGNAASSDMGIKICAYSDMRVAPWGVTSLAERTHDGHLRYNGTTKFHADSPVAQFDAAMLTIEKQIFAHCKIHPADITEEAITPLKEALKKFEI